MNSQIKIRKAIRKDIQQIVHIEMQCFDIDSFTERQFSNLLNNKNSYFFVACLNKTIVGYIILLKRKNCKKLRIYSIAVDLNVRNQHIGSAMLEYAEKIANDYDFHELSLEVSEKNLTAQYVYKKHNFIVIGTKSNYYKDESNALVMRKKLSTITKNKTL